TTIAPRYGRLADAVDGPPESADAAGAITGAIPASVVGPLTAKDSPQRGQATRRNAGSGSGIGTTALQNGQVVVCGMAVRALRADGNSEQCHSSGEPAPLSSTGPLLIQPGENGCAACPVQSRYWVRAALRVLPQVPARGSVLTPFPTPL